MSDSGVTAKPSSKPASKSRLAADAKPWRPSSLSSSNKSSQSGSSSATLRVGSSHGKYVASGARGGSSSGKTSPTMPTPRTPTTATDFWATHKRNEPLTGRGLRQLSVADFESWLARLGSRKEDYSAEEKERLMPLIEETSTHTGFGSGGNNNGSDRFSRSQGRMGMGQRIERGSIRSSLSRGSSSSAARGGHIVRGQGQRNSKSGSGNNGSDAGRQWTRGMVAPKPKSAEEDVADLNGYVPKKAENGWTHEKHQQMIATHEDEVKKECNVILNKLSLENFQKLSRSFLKIDVRTKVEFEIMIDYIFNKAVMQHAFSGMYADLCRLVGENEGGFLDKIVKVELAPKARPSDKQQFQFSVGSEIDPKKLKAMLKTRPFRFVTETDAVNAGRKYCSFSRLLRARCQQEFERETNWEKWEADLKAKNLSGVELEVAKEELEQKILLSKARVFGNIKFIGELYKVKLVPDKIIKFCMHTQLIVHVDQWRSNNKTPMDEKTLESACRLLQTTGKMADTPKNKSHVESWIGYLKLLVSPAAKGAVSTRLKFLCQEVIEMRDNDWKGKYKQKTIMTKEESRALAHKEEVERASKAKGRGKKKDAWRKGRNSGNSSRNQRGATNRGVDGNNTNRTGRGNNSSPPTQSNESSQITSSVKEAEVIKPIDAAKVKGMLDEFRHLNSESELFQSLAALEVKPSQAAGVMLEMLRYCVLSILPTVEKTAAIFVRVISNKEPSFDFSWASPASVAEALRGLFDLEHPSSYLGDMKLDAPKAVMLLSVVMAKFISAGIITPKNLFGSEQAEDARDSGLAAEVCVELIKALKANEGYDVAPLLASLDSVKLPRWELMKERLE